MNPEAAPASSPETPAMITATIGADVRPRPKPITTKGAMKSRAVAPGTAA